MMETSVVDALDRRLIHALLHNGRLPFSRIADVLGVSEQTVARRYRRLREAGIARVIVLRDPRRYRENVFLRIRTRPGAAKPIGESLSRRPDVSWVALTTAGTEVTCAMRTDDERTRDHLLVEKLPKLAQITDVSSAVLLHVFTDDRPGGWRQLDDGLTTEELRALGPVRARPGRLQAGADEPVLTADDQALLDHLAIDGRLSFKALAAAVHRSEAVVARRVNTLLDHGTLFVSTEVAAAPLGFRTTATLWLRVAPSELSRVGAELARHPEVEFSGAVSGAANLAVSLVCRDHADLHRYVTERLGAVEAITGAEIVVVRRVKQAGTIMDGDRLPNPLLDGGAQVPTAPAPTRGRPGPRSRPDV